MSDGDEALERSSLRPFEGPIDRPALAALEACSGEVRLIDNVELG